jgi:3-oxoacyl-[acyl-carrier-protein] synthase III
MQHTDVMQQWISYKVPTDKLNELAMYDGSVVVERTTGMISARCDKEGANFLALNLAHDIATGKRSVEDAREMYGKEVMKMKAGQMTEYTKGLMFSANLNAADADVALEKKNM